MLLERGGFSVEARYEGCDDLWVLAGYILRLIWVGLMIEQFSLGFAAVIVLHEAVPIGSEGAALLPKAVGGIVGIKGRVFKEGDQAPAIQAGWLRQAGKLSERWVKVYGFDNARGSPTCLWHVGDADDQCASYRPFESRMLAPNRMVAEVPSMIAPDYYNGVIRQP